MYCIQCGKKIENSTARFCPFCGAPVSQTKPAGSSSGSQNMLSLVEKAQKGDSSAFGTLYQATYKDMYYLALKLMKNEAAAEDVLQDAYIKAWNNISSLQDPSVFKGWMSRIVSNTAKNALVKKTPTLFSQLETEDEDGEETSFDIEDENRTYQPENNYTERETQDLVREMIDSLSDEQRFCILMFHLENHSIREIAETLNVSENTVKSRLNYGRKNLAKKAEELQKKGYRLFTVAPVQLLLYLLRAERNSASFAQSAASLRLSGASTHTAPHGSNGQPAPSQAAQDAARIRTHDQYVAEARREAALRGKESSEQFYSGSQAGKAAGTTAPASISGGASSSAAGSSAAGAASTAVRAAAGSAAGSASAKAASAAAAASTAAKVSILGTVGGKVAIAAAAVVIAGGAAAGTTAVIHHQQQTRNEITIEESSDTSDIVITESSGSDIVITEDSGIVITEESSAETSRDLKAEADAVEISVTDLYQSVLDQAPDGSSYCLYDMDGDGIAELFVMTETASGRFMVKTTDIYTCVETDGSCSLAQPGTGISLLNFYRRSDGAGVYAVDYIPAGTGMMDFYLCTLEGGSFVQGDVAASSQMGSSENDAFLAANPAFEWIDVRTPVSGCVDRSILIAALEGSEDSSEDTSEEPKEQTSSPETSSFEEISIDQLSSLISGNLSLDELQSVLAYGPTSLLASPSQSEVQRYLNELSQSGNSELNISYMGDQAILNMALINRWFSAFSDYQFSAENWGVVQRGQYIPFYQAQIEFTAQADITGAGMEGNDLVIYYNYTYTDYENSSRNISCVRKAIFTPLGDGTYRLSETTEE